MVEQKRLKYPLEVVVEEFRVHGFQIVGPYVDTRTPVEVICPNGHRSAVARTNFKKTKLKCRYCANVAPLTQEGAIAEFAKHGYTLTGAYNSVTSRVETVCPKGHLGMTPLSVVRRAARNGKGWNGCKKCSSPGMKSHAEVEEAFKARGFKLFSIHTKHSDRLDVECPNGHRWETSYGSFSKTAFGCPFCTGVRLSKEQKESSRLAMRMRIRVLQMLERKGHVKNYKMESFPATRAREIIQVLGGRPEGYSIDHIVPVSFFDHRSFEEVKSCWAIANLRWLPAEENLLRKNRLTHEEVAQFSEEQLSILRTASFKPEKFNCY